MTDELESTPMPSALASLGRMLRASLRDREARLLHPRKDHMWIDRDGDGYLLQLNKGEERLPMSEAATKELSSLLDVGTRLLGRLREIPRKDEDCRLLNTCLWYAGEAGQAGFWVRIRDDRVVSVRGEDYTPVHLITLLDGLEALENDAGLRLLRYEHKDRALRLVLRHENQDPLDLHRRRDDTRIQWYAGAILTNHEDGSHAATVAPALVSYAGEKALPIPHSRTAISRRRHRDESPSALTQHLLGDLAATATAPYKEMAGRWMRLFRRSFKAGEVRTVLDATGVRLPKKKFARAVEDRIGNRSSSQYWLIHALLSEAETLEPVARFRLEAAVGRLVWARGK